MLLHAVHDGGNHFDHIQQLVVHAAARFNAPQLAQYSGKLVAQCFVNPRIALYYHVLASQAAGDVVLLRQPRELHIAFDLSALLR